MRGGLFILHIYVFKNCKSQNWKKGFNKKSFRKTNFTNQWGRMVTAWEKANAVFQKKIDAAIN